MERELVSKDQLLGFLNTELSKLPDYQDCCYEDVSRLDHVDESGCNWKDAILKCSGMHAGTCQPAGFRILEEARRRYNLS